MNIPVITPLVHYFHVFYSYAGKRLYALLLLIFFVGISEGIGISMLLPVLNLDKPKGAYDSYTKVVYDFLERTGVGVSLAPLLFILFSAFLLKSIFYFSQTALSSHIVFNLSKNMKIEFCRKYKLMRYDYYTNTSIGYFNNIITTEIDRLVSGLEIYIRLIVNVIYIAVYLFAVFMINWKITTVVIIVCLFLFAILRGVTRMTRRLGVFITQAHSDIQSLLLQTIYNFKYLKATNSFSRILRKLYKRIDDNKRFEFNKSLLLAIPSSIIEPVSIIILSGLVLYFVEYKGQAIAAIMVTLLFFYRTITRIFRFQIDWQKFNGSIGAIDVVEKISRILDSNKEATGARVVRDFEGVIELKGVSFSYGSREVLNEIELTIPRNKTIGIVGESGAGKTTIFAILTGLLRPQRGKVCIDGTDYKELDIKELRNLIGYITQEPVIFNDSIENNISLWECDNKDNGCRERVEKAASLAKCEKFISESENKYETIIGDKGVKLSGGQCQRIAIAREIFKDLPIMIFDEATSSLDTESEKFIQNSINSMVGEKTLIIITHRLSTIRHCDYIYVLKEGRIVNEGGFDELYEDKDSIFSKMCQAQNV